jgi:RNA polymerase sigma-70 factor (ECF subfamily)
MATTDWDELIEGVRSGDDAALHRFFNTYGPALERLAARAIEPQMRRRFGPESIAQSVCRTFLRRARGDGFELTDGDALWRLLCAIALTKVREKVRFHMRHRRGLDREVPLDADGRDPHGVSPDRSPPPDEQAAFADAFAHLVESLEDEERRVLELRLEDRTQQEIAAEVGCSERTVRRLMRRLETRLLEAFAA